MKKGLILLGTLPVALLTAGLVFNNSGSEDGVYESRQTTHINQNTPLSQGMLEYYDKLRGDVTPEMYARVRSMVDEMPVNRASVSWNEMGPDNIGGRTRAIVVDRNDINHVWAGSVSGGLFESINRANFWEPVTEFTENLSISSMCQTIDGTLYIATGHQQETTGGSQSALDTGGNGDGLWKMNSDGTFTQIAGTGQPTISYINEVVCDDVNNLVWFATNQGLKTYDPGTDQVNDIDNGLTNGACISLSISTDGQVIVCSMTGGRTNVSIDGGQSFTERTGTGPGEIQGGAGRIEYAISNIKNNSDNYSVYASCANSTLQGVWMSQDNGINWTQIAPSNNGQPGSLAPFDVGGGGQGLYDNIITVAHDNPNKLILGGIDLYSWATTGNWSQISQWFLPPQSPLYVHADNHELTWDSAGRLYIGNDGGIAFSDDGGTTFHPANRGYNVTQFYAIGASAHGDVIGGTQDNGSLANFHDNATWHEFDEVTGGDGFTAEISFINRDVAFTTLYYGGLFRSSDRGETANLFVPTEFSTAGLDNLGCNPGSTTDGCGQFFTQMRLWENPNDLNSADSVSFVPTDSYSIGDTIEVPSETAQTTIFYESTTNVTYEDTVYYNPLATGQDTIITSAAPSNDYNLAVFDYSHVVGAPEISAGDSIYLTDLDTTVYVESFYTIPHYYATNSNAPGDTLDLGNDTVAFGIAWDTLMVQDPYQSWMVIGLGGGQGIWMTRNALRLSSPSSAWFKVNHSNIGTVATMEFSRDGEHLFIGTWGGALYRLSGFNDVYSPVKGEDTLIDANLVTNVANLQTTFDQVGTFGAPITGIGVEGDPDHVVVTLGNYSGNNKVRESTNATGGAPTWNNISGNLPQSHIPSAGALPVYGVVIDRNDPNIIVIATDMGMFVTENGGTLWEECSGGIGRTPVFDVRQNWRTWDEGCFRPGEIYAGTHGRGIWASEDYLSTSTGQDNLSSNKYQPNINIYPNPMVDQGTIAFELESNSNVNVQIFNISGQLVREMSETNVGAGQNNMKFSTIGLDKGTYIVRLTAGSRVETSKFIKQ